MNYDYRIADLHLRMSGPAADLSHIDGFETFRLTGTAASAQPDLVFNTGVRIPDWRFYPTVRLLHKQSFDGIECTLWRGADTFFFSMSSERHGSTGFSFTPGCRNVTSDAGLHGPAAPEIMRFLVWTAFNLCAAEHRSIAVHSSVVAWRGRAVMFLGESGTGKSTHTRLWCKSFPAARLLNDDSPVLRIAARGPVVYGSPWSGKTPCYVPLSFPLAACVRLVQAPRNKISRLSSVEAFGALFPSCPPSLAGDEQLTDALCDIVSQVVGSVPVYRLECLPDSAAALLAMQTVFG